MQAFYVFRPIDDYGNTYIQVSDSFFDSKPKDSTPYLLATFLILACALILAGIYYNPWFIVPGVICIPMAIWAERQRVKGQKIKEDSWQKSFTNRPGRILTSLVFSKKYSKFANLIFAKQKGAVIDKNTRASVVKIDLTSSPFFNDYKATIGKTLEIARQNKGDIAWLWEFGPYTVFGDDFSITYQDFHDRNLDQELHINLDVKTSNILPIVETEYSFIFCLDYFSDEMEKNYTIPDEIIEALSKKTKNSSGTTINDDLFRLNEF
jgi:hypothetical protein